MQLQPGRRVEDLQAALPQVLQAAGLEAADAAGIAVVRPQDTDRRTDDLSRAYRVNLTVLALVALFTGGYLVFSVLALSVARRGPQFALLAVLGATPRMRRALVLAESAALGAAGSVAGIALGTGLAALALRAMGGDLGGGVFRGGASLAAVERRRRPAVCGAGNRGRAGRGLVARALGGTAGPGRRALKGAGTASDMQPRLALPTLCAAAGCALAFAPPVAGLPLGAYASVALLLVGGIGLLPVLVHGLLSLLAPGQAVAR